MKVRISDMLDCSAEILTQEQESEECSPDEIVKIVFERLEIKRRRKRKRYIGTGLIACTLCGCVGAKVILNPGGRATDPSVFQAEAGFIEEESSEDSHTSIKTDFIDDRYLCDEQGNPIAKYILEIDTNYQEDKLYLDNGTMLILNNKDDGMKTNVSIDITLMIEQENTNGGPGTVEIGYLLDGKPYCIEKNNNYETAVSIKGKEGKKYYPYLKNISSDRVIINIKYERVSFMKKLMSVILAGLLLFSLSSHNVVYASDSTDQEIRMNILDRMGIPSTTIAAGKTVNFIDNDGQAFYVPSGAKVTFTVNLKSSASVELGYVRNSGSKVKTYSGTAKSHTTTFTIPSTGYYKFYITNKASGSITVTGGSLTF